MCLGEAHLRRIMSRYASYYNQARTHLALGKDAPISRPVQLFGSSPNPWSPVSITATLDSSLWDGPPLPAGPVEYRPFDPSKRERTDEDSHAWH